MKNLYVLFFIITVCCFACQPTKVIETKPELPFPQSWEGMWEGRLEIFNAKGKVQETLMGLEIKPIDSTKTHTWTIIYSEGEKRQVREYELIPKDPAKGHYVIDEKNSIILDDYYYGNTLYSRFDVGGTLLLATYTKEGETIRFEIIAGKTEPISETGGADDIPKVNSYGISVGQRAILKRKVSK